MRTRSLLAGLVALTFVVAACGDDDDDGGGGEDAATSTTAAEPLEILVTNDDGVEGEGIDVLTQALQDLPDVEVTVVAPAEDQSGTGDQTTEGEVQYSETELASGIPATAVEGFPADSVNVALEELGLEPDLVVSGSNAGQNIGTLTQLSGTVGAAATAARQGVPAVAVSQGLADPIDYESGVEDAIAWITDHRDDYVSGEADPLVNINTPSCTSGEVRGTVEVPVAQQLSDTELDPVDCTSTVEDPPDDVTAFIEGFTAISVLDPESI